MTSAAPSPRSRWLLAVPGLAAGLLLLRLVLVWAARAPYPFDLEWMEGGMLLLALRLSRGLPLYPEPGREFISHVYPPGYPSLVAILGAATGGIDYTAARAASLVGTLAAAAAVVRIVRQDGGSLAWGLLGAAMFLGCYEASGAFYDLARPDGVLIGLLAWSLALGLDPRKRALDVAALMLAAAFLVKQNAAALGIAMALGIGLRDGHRAALRFALWSAGPALAVVGLLQTTSDGLFLTYILGVPASHELRGERMFPGLPVEIGRALPVASAVVMAFAVGRLRRSPSWRTVYGLAAGLVIATITTLMRGHVGGYVNVLIPLHWALCAGAAVGLSRWDRARPSLVWLLALVVAAQLGWQACEAWRWRDRPRQPDPHASGWRRWVAADPLVPTAADVAAGDAIVTALREEPGPLWSPFAPWLAVKAGHIDPGPMLITLWDIDRDRGPLRRGVDDIEEAVSSGWYATIVDGTRRLRYGTDEFYVPAYGFDIRAGVFDPKTGWRVRPARILHPRRP